MQGGAKIHGVPSFGTDLRVCDSVEDALYHKSCHLVWNGDSTQHPQPTLSFSSQIIAIHFPTFTPVPSSSLSSASSSIPTVTPTSSTVSLSSSLPPAASSRTRPNTPLPTSSPVLVGDESGGNDEPNEPDFVPLVVLRRRAYVRSFISEIFDAVADKPTTGGAWNDPRH